MINRLRDLFTCMLLLGIGAGMGSGTVAAFTQKADNGDNRIRVGTVTLTDDDGDTRSMFTTTGARPNQPVDKCIVLSYTGSLPAQVRMFGTASGALAPYVTVEVVRGTKAPATDASCTGFNADTTNHYGLGAGVVWSGALDDFPPQSTPVLDPGTWTNPTNRAYRFRISVDNTPDAQGLNAALSVTWEAENL